MSLSGVSPTPEPQNNKKVQKSEVKKDENGSIFSKYDSNKDGKVDANEQRLALTDFVADLYRNMKKNMNMTAINIISKFSKNFKDFKTDGSSASAEDVNVKIDKMLNVHGNNIVKLIANGNDRTKDFESHTDFIKAKDLKVGDYCISEKGYIYQFNGEGKNWSLYGGDIVQ